MPQRVGAVRDFSSLGSSQAAYQNHTAGIYEQNSASRIQKGSEAQDAVRNHGRSGDSLDCGSGHKLESVTPEEISASVQPALKELEKGAKGRFQNTTRELLVAPGSVEISDTGTGNGELDLAVSGQSSVDVQPVAPKAKLVDVQRVAPVKKTPNVQRVAPKRKRSKASELPEWVQMEGFSWRPDGYTGWNLWRRTPAKSKNGKRSSKHKWVAHYKKAAMERLINESKKR